MNGHSIPTGSILEGENSLEGALREGKKELKSGSH
ncbi:hypothetical protein [Robertmurraya siralis]